MGIEHLLRPFRCRCSRGMGLNPSFSGADTRPVIGHLGGFIRAKLRGGPGEIAWDSDKGA